MAQPIQSGSTGNTIYLFIASHTSPTDGLTGLTSGTAGFSMCSIRDRGAAVAIVLQAQTPTGAWVSGGFCAVSDSLAPGVYRLDVPDTVAAAGVNAARIMWTGGGAVDDGEDIPLPNYNPTTTIGTIETHAAAIDTLTAANLDAQVSTVAAAVWAVGTRTLSSFGTLTTDTAAAVWGAGTRSLTTFGTLVSDTTTAVWGAASRSLTTYGTLAADTATAVWGAGTRSLTTFGTLAADTATAVWGAGTRSLTSFGTLVSDITTAVWAATTRTLTAVSDSSGVTTLLGRITQAPPTATQVADAFLDRTDAIETGVAPRGALRLVLAALVGNLTNTGGNITIRNAIVGSKTRITATGDGTNRTVTGTDLT